MHIRLVRDYNLHWKDVKAKYLDRKSEGRQVLMEGERSIN
jgi:hypothetical protein